MGNKSNRGMKAKLRKKANRGRYAKFSGATTRVLNIRVEEKLVHNGDLLDAKGKRAVLKDDQVQLRTVEVYVGPAHLSKQVVNTGRGPNSERMAEYYGRIQPKSWLDIIHKSLNRNEPMNELVALYKKVRADTPKENRLTIVDNPVAGRVDMFFTHHECWLVHINYQEKTFSVSRDYGNSRVALSRYKSNRVVWSQTISAAPPLVR